MSPTPKIPVTGELWLNADGFPQLTSTAPSALADALRMFGGAQ